MRIFHVTSPTDALRADLGDRRFTTLDDSTTAETYSPDQGAQDDRLIAALRSCGFFVRQMGLLEGQRPQVLGSIDNAIAFYKLAVAGADAGVARHTAVGTVGLPRTALLAVNNGSEAVSLYDLAVLSIQSFVAPGEGIYVAPVPKAAQKPAQEAG